MASFTEAHETANITNGGRTARTFGHEEALGSVSPVDGGRTARTFGHEEALGSAGPKDYGHTIRRFVHEEALGSAGPKDYGHTIRRFAHVEDHQTVRPQSGIPIPSGAFRRVEIDLYDDDGNPLEGALWVQSAGVFPTAARVQTREDGSTFGTLFLLEGIAYFEFLVLGKNPDPNGPDFVWYQAVEDAEIGPSSTTGSITFEPKVPLNGTYVGGGIGFGGGGMF